MEKVRFRFIRPLALKDGKLITSPTGGVCLMFELLEDGTELAFSYALCKDDEPFSKVTASKIAEARMETMKRLGAFLPVSNVKMIAPAVRHWCKTTQFPDTVLPYLVIDIRALGNAIERVLSDNEMLKRQVKSDEKRAIASGSV
jgi:hypothetical protein